MGLRGEEWFRCAAAGQVCGLDMKTVSIQICIYYNTYRVPWCMHGFAAVRFA
jgi:hypothetical protein